LGCRRADLDLPRILKCEERANQTRGRVCIFEVLAGYFTDTKVVMGTAMVRVWAL
jgi:hypothetical protein